MLAYTKSAVLLLCTVWFCVNASPTSIDEKYPVTRGGCDPQNGTSKRYYVYNNRGVTFFEAWRLCQSVGLRLATITSPDDSRLIAEATQASSNPKGPWWVSGTDHGNKGIFVWISTNQPVGYGNGYFDFDVGQPDNAGGIEDCMEIARGEGVRWNDIRCELKQRYICENVL
ncbi:perlucin-like [Anopheles cruzii]|uniref:perlucin-like n=1 Tax=Anopheles cruzii TaxID=68878 RepID=UPI0022EC8176|nr:perlucin-like [Anopheles cruzii]